MARDQGEPRGMLFAISVAAELAGMHPQTLRQYDRLGLVRPARSKGRGRRYTARDVQRLRDVQRMSQEDGINLAGIRRILELEEQVERLRDHGEQLRRHLEELEDRRDRIFAASATGEVSPLRRGQRIAWPDVSAGHRTDVVLWDPLRAAIAHRIARATIEAPRPAASASVRPRGAGGGGGVDRVVEGTFGAF